MNIRKVLIILILVLVISIIILVNIFNKNESENYKDEKYIPQNQEEQIETKYDSQIETDYSKIMNNEEKLKIEKCIDEILDMINNKKYEELYNKLDIATKENFYPTYKTFEEKFLKKVTDNKYFCDGYIAEFYGYNCFFYTESISGDSKNNISMIIAIEKNGDYRIILNELINTKPLGIVKAHNGMSITLEKELNYLNKTEYKIKLKNNNKNKIKVEFSKISAVSDVNGYENEIEIENKISAVEIYPNKTKDIILSFDKIKYLSKKPEWISIECTINGKYTFYELYSDYLGISLNDL